MIKSKEYSGRICPVSRFFDFQLYLQCWSYHYYLLNWCCLNTFEFRYRISEVCTKKIFLVMNLTESGHERPTNIHYCKRCYTFIHIAHNTIVFSVICFCLLNLVVYSRNVYFLTLFYFILFPFSIKHWFVGT